MRIVALQSGSNGNCVYVEAGGVRLLFDAGISLRQARLRLAGLGLSPEGAAALLISHDHSDHVRSAGVYQRALHVPLHVTAGTLAAASRRMSLGELDDVQHFLPGSTVPVGDVEVRTLATPHDGCEGVAFIVDDGRVRLGIFTDLGHVFAGLGEAVAECDAVLLESNYDEQMLTDGPYPAFLKARIRGAGGHISNAESADLLAAAAGARLQWACLAHLSHENNTPELALQTHRDRLGGKLPIHVATRYGATGIMEI
ncbi:MAG: MBL fold metallo-hydrolase [Planctomycetaceae bacterium]|nr:MBL fold metallo-hydrolase [Planctomycetaceae bacterium]